MGDIIEAILRAKRIMILGCSGSGKTHLVLQLSPLLGLEAIHLDYHFWKPGWVASEPSEWEACVADLARRPSWIMDGCFERSLALRLPRADLVILMESNRWSCLWRIIKRKLTIDDHVRPDAPPGQSVDFSAIRYVWRYPTVWRPHIERCIQRFGPANVVRVRGPAGGRRLLDQLRQHLERRELSAHHADR